MVFIEKFMPSQVIELPDGTEVVHHMRTSDKPLAGDERDPRKIISEAMDAYLAWLCDMGIEVTVPEEGWK